MNGRIMHFAHANQLPLYRDCKALLDTSLTHVTSAIASARPLPFYLLVSSDACGAQADEFLQLATVTGKIFAFLILFYNFKEIVLDDYYFFQVTRWPSCTEPGNGPYS